MRMIREESRKAGISGGLGQLKSEEGGTWRGCSEWGK
jgi:hypothetical protein